MSKSTTVHEMHNDPLILVTGATGQQGGAVARHLLADGWRVRALTRNTARPAARALAQLGADVIQGDLEHPDSLSAALADVYGVFAVQTNWEDGVESEVRQGTNLAELSRAAGVQHFVYTSVGGADRKSGVPHFESKAEIERQVGALDLPFTIVRPVFFMENFATVFRPTSGVDGTVQLALALPPDRRLQLIAVDDIGAIVARIFAHRDAFLGRSMEIAGDELTPVQIVAEMSRVLGTLVRYVRLPIDVVRAFNEDVALNFLWLTEHGYKADIAGVRRLYPMTRFDRWLRLNGWTNERVLVAPQTA